MERLNTVKKTLFRLSNWILDKIPFYTTPIILVFILLSQFISRLLDINVAESLLINIGIVGMLVGLIQILAFWISTYEFMTKPSLYDGLLKVRVVHRPKLVVIKGGKDRL